MPHAASARGGPWRTGPCREPYSQRQDRRSVAAVRRPVRGRRVLRPALLGAGRSALGEATASVGGLPVSPGWTLRGALGAYLGHEARDNMGQQRCPAGSCALALTSGEGSEQWRSPGHAVYGMQGVRTVFPQLSRGLRTTHDQGPRRGPLSTPRDLLATLHPQIVELGCSQREIALL